MCRCYPERWLSTLAKFRIEPLLLLFSTTQCFYSAAAGSLILQRVCFPDGPPGIDVVCKNKERIALATDISTVRNAIGQCIPGVVTILAGSWRDATGHSRPLMILGHIGDMLGVIVCLFASIFWTLSPWFTSITSSIIAGIFGSQSIVILAVICLVTDNSSTQERTFRLAIIVVSLLGGMAVATASSGYILFLLDYRDFFIFVFSLFAASLSLTIFLVDDKENRARNSSGYFESLSRLRLVFKPKPNGTVAWLLIISTWITVSMLTGEVTVAFSYLQQVYKFSVKEIGLFTSYKTTITIISTLVMPPLMQKLFKWSDFRIGMVSAVTTIIANIALAFAKTPLQLYLYSALDFLRITAIVVLRSLLTKCVKNEELGSYFSLCTIGEILFQLAFLPFYDWIFKITISYFPGAFYLISAVCMFLLLCLLSISEYLFKEQPQEPDVEPISCPDDEDMSTGDENDFEINTSRP